MACNSKKAVCRAKWIEGWDSVVVVISKWSSLCLTLESISQRSRHTEISSGIVELSLPTLSVTLEVFSCTAFNRLFCACTYNFVAVTS